MSKKIYPRIADFLNRPIEIPYPKGFVKRITQWGKRLNLPTDPPGTEPTGLVGKLRDENQSPFTQGNFLAARWETGKSLKDLVFTEMEYNKDLWSTSYDWKIKLVEPITIFRQNKETGVMDQTELETGSFHYLNLSFAQNKKLEEIMGDQRGVKVIPVKMSIKKDDGKTGSAVVFQVVGSPVQANQVTPVQAAPEAKNSQETPPEQPVPEEKKDLLPEYGRPEDLPF